MSVPPGSSEPDCQQILPCPEDADPLVGVFVFARTFRAGCGAPPGWLDGRGVADTDRQFLQAENSLCHARANPNRIGRQALEHADPLGPATCKV